MELIRQYGPPHVTWLVAALLVQRERQRWHHDVTRSVRDDDDFDGPLADLPGWAGNRHGIGICLEGRDGELLDVDFNDETGAVIDVWFFANRVQSLKDSPHWLAERRLWRWRPSRAVIVDGCQELVARGAASYFTTYKNKIVLAPELDAKARAVAEDLARPGVEQRWLDALEPGGEGAHLEHHRGWIRERLRSASSSSAAHFLDLAIHASTSDEAVELCRPMLERPGWAAGHAIELLRARPDGPLVPEVAKLLRRASLANDHPFTPFQACAYLFERGIERELVMTRFSEWASLKKAHGYDGNPMQGHFAILALKFVPDRAMSLVRATLRSTTPICVQEISALLAAIDQRWCHRELGAALAEVRHASHAYLAAALRETTSDVAKRRADAAPGPDREPNAIGFTFDEVLHASAGSHMAHELEQWRTLAADLRVVYPEDWDGSWPVLPR